MSKELLFAGSPEFFGGLTNEIELAKLCPKKFRQNNPWSRYASKFFQGGNTQSWTWKSNDNNIRKKQLACLQGLLGSFGIPHQDKEAIAGWMLSEMIVEIPKDAYPKDV